MSIFKETRWYLETKDSTGKTEVYRETKHGREVIAVAHNHCGAEVIMLALMDFGKANAARAAALEQGESGDS